MKPRLLALVLAAAGAAAACSNRFEAVVDGVLLADSDSGEQLTAEMRKAPRVLVRAEPSVPDEQLPLPASGAVQLVIERNVPWARVETLLAILESKKLEPILLAGHTHQLRRFQLNDTLTGAEKFTITGDAKGKFCVQTAQLPQAYCVAGAGRHVHRAFVRETVRDVVKKWEMREAMAYVDPATDWADVVRIVDGARTCCRGGTKVLVAVAREAPLGADAEAGNPAILEQERAAAAAEGTVLEGDEPAPAVAPAAGGSAAAPAAGGSAAAPAPAPTADGSAPKSAPVPAPAPAPR